MDTNAPLEELLRGFADLYPVPLEPLKIDSEDSLRLMLELLVPDHGSWGTDGRSKPVDYLISEFLRNEAVFTLIDLRGQRILRDIRTATINVTTMVPSPTERAPTLKKKLVLKEEHLVNGVMVPRRYQNSMSEKLFVTDESYLPAVARALQEELGIEVREEHLRPPHLFPMSEYQSVQYVRAQETPEFSEERDIRTSGRYPGILVRNMLQHFIWVMPEEYFNPDGYHEQGTNHYFRWEEVA